VDAAAGKVAWKAVSKQATAGTPGGSDRVDCVERRRLVQGGEIGQVAQRGHHLGVEQDGRGERVAAVDDAVADGVDRTEIGQLGIEAIRAQLGKRREIPGRLELIAIADHPQLDARGPYVDDEDPFRARHDRGIRRRACTRGWGNPDKMAGRASAAISSP